MGNTHAFAHRIPALTAAIVSSSALTLIYISGAGCSFLEINARNGEFLVRTEPEFQEEGILSTTIGVLCDGGFYIRQGDDQLWNLSRIFFFVCLALGSVGTALAWAVSTFLPPTERNWKMLSILASLTAVVEVPVFLIFEAEPCSEYLAEQRCRLSTGSYFLMASIVSWVLVTFMTQYLDPPLWAIELNAWRVHKGPRRQPHGFRHSDDESGDNENGQPARNDNSDPTSAKSLWGRLRNWPSRRRLDHSNSLPMVPTESASREDDADPQQHYPELDSYYADSNNSRLLLKVMPDGKRPGDDSRSMASFGDLDSIVRLAEEGKLPTLTPDRYSTPLSDDSRSLRESKRSGSEDRHAVLILDTTRRADPEIIVVGDDGEDGVELQQRTGQQQPEEDRHAVLLQLQQEEEADDEEELRISAQTKANTAINATARTSDSTANVSSTDGRDHRKRKRPRSSRRRHKKRLNSAVYALLLDDEDEVSSRALPPIEVTISKDGGSEDTGNTSSPSPPRVSPNNNYQQFFENWTDLHGHDSEDAVDMPFKTGSFDSAESSSTISSISNASGIQEDQSREVPKPQRLRNRKKPPSTRRTRKSPRRSPHKISSGGSKSPADAGSASSLLDLTIEEETDKDLLEFLTSEDEESSNGKLPKPPPSIQRTSSEPLLGFSPTRDRNIKASDARSLSGVEDCIRHRDRIMLDRYTPVGVILAIKRTKRMKQQEQKFVSSYVKSERPIESDAATTGGIFRNRNPLPTRVPDLRSSRSCDECFLSWREERVYKGGIHASTAVISDSSSSGSGNTSSASTHKLQERARQARIQRLQRESDEVSVTRRRNKVILPRRHHRQRLAGVPAEYAFVLDTLDLHFAECRRPQGAEYGSDEASM